MLLIDGKKVAAELRLKVRNEVDAIAREYGRPPHLAVILVGDDPASQVYVRYKEKACEEVGIASRIWRLDAGTTQCALERHITELCESDDIDGILLQLPLPRGLDANRCLAIIDPKKDVDGFHPENVGRPGRRHPSGVDRAPLRSQSRHRNHEPDPQPAHHRPQPTPRTISDLVRSQTNRCARRTNSR